MQRLIVHAGRLDLDGSHAWQQSGSEEKSRRERALSRDATNARQGQSMSPMRVDRFADLMSTKDSQSLRPNPKLHLLKPSRGARRKQRATEARLSFQESPLPYESPPLFSRSSRTLMYKRSSRVVSSRRRGMRERQCHAPAANRAEQSVRMAGGRGWVDG